MGTINGKTFKSGNSEAIRLPKGVGFGIGTEMRIEREGDRIVLTPIVDPDSQQRQMEALFADMLAIGAPPDGVQARDPFEFPDRTGL